MRHTFFTTSLSLAFAASLALVGCDSGDGSGTDTDTADPTTETTGDATDTSDSETAGPAGVPTNSAELLPWLEANSYSSWTAESDVHASTGPHGEVRTYINANLETSLMGGGDHSEGAASVKELYSGGTLIGWAVMVKIQADSDGGNGWYWYEKLNDDVIADGNGDGTCTGCHSSGSADFFKTVYPLE